MKDKRGSGSKANVGRKKLGKTGFKVQSTREHIQKVREYAERLYNESKRNNL